MNLNQYIDHTLIRPEATVDDIKALCKEAKEHHFKAVCVNPCYVKLAFNELFGCDTTVCSVIGFPLGANHGQTKVYETTHAIEDGAHEIDMVINVGDVKSDNFPKVEREIEEILVECKKSNKVLKVILGNITSYRRGNRKALRDLQGPSGRFCEDLHWFWKAWGHGRGREAYAKNCW